MKSINTFLFISFIFLILHSCKEKVVVIEPKFPKKTWICSV